MMYRPVLIALILLIAVSAHAQEPVWQADLSAPTGGFGTYNDNAAVAVTSAEDAGERIVRAVAPGTERLEGLSIVTAPALPGGRRATISTEVRGSGDLWLIAHSRNGWLYSRSVAALTDQWQSLQLTKPLGLTDDRMTICLVTREIGPMTVELRSLSVAIEPAPAVSDVAVEPVKLEAEAFSAYARQLRQVEGASGAAVVSGADFALLSGIPCPRTSRPIYLFARTRLAGPQSSWGVMVDTGGGTQRINTLAGEDTREWQWITGAPFTAAMVGDSFRLQLFGPRDAAGETELDAIVLTTEAEPTAEQLDAAAPVAFDAPLLAVGRAETPPALDGVGDDACWQQAVALTGFTRVNSAAPADHATEMRLCRDDDALYWWFRGEEPVLRPEMNRIGDFRRSITERDGDVWRDDAAALVLDTGDGLFDLFVNALGTVNDSRIGQLTDMWGSRDQGFDADVEVATAIDDGFWTIEARIGLASLGGAPEAGASWRFIAGRIAQADRESSAWNLCVPGMHDPSAFATLAFVDQAPGAVISLPEPLQPGSNDVRAQIENAAGGVLLGTSVAADGPGARQWSFGAEGEISTPLPVEREGELRFRYALLDAATLTPLLVSPQYSRQVRSSTATVALQTDAPWTLLVNGERVASGASAALDQPATVFLQRGVNAFGLELQGEAQVRIEAGDVIVTAADPWRVAPEDADLSAPAVDPRAWEVAAGEALGPGRFRFEVLWEDTRAFPTSQPALYVAQGTSQHLMIAARGLPGHVVEGYRCHFWLPEPLELVGATGYYNTREEQPEYTIEAAGEVAINGVPHTHYIVSADQPIRYSQDVRILEVFNAFFAWRDGFAPEDRDYVIHYASEALGGSIREARRQVTVRPLPALEGAQPERLVWQMWGSFFSNMNRADCKRLSMATMQATGFNNMVSGDRETSEIGGEYGIENVLSVNFEPWSINMVPWLEEHPETALVDRTGAESDQYVCTTVLLADACEVMQESIRAQIAERRPDWVTWDFESGVMAGYLSCFCPRCLEAFREQAGIAANVPLDAETIEREHLPAWTEFMNRRMAEVALRMKEACHSAEPPARLQIYSGYQSEDTKWRYGVDWAMIGELQACDIAGCGYGRRWETVAATHEALAGIPLIVGQLMRPYDRNSDEAVTPLTRAVMLQRLMDCTGGVLVYDRMPMEGRSWQASAEVSRLAAAYDEVFAEGEFAGVGEAELGADWAAARALDDTMIVAMMNTSTTPRTLALTLPGGYTRCTEFFSGQPATSGEQVSLELAPGDARAWVLER